LTLRRRLERTDVCCFVLGKRLARQELRSHAGPVL
jgi:hypothetical protein